MAKGSKWQNPETAELARKYKKEAEEQGLSGSKLYKYIKKKCQPTTECLDVADNCYPDGAATLHAKDILVELSATDKPFFFAIGITKPHLPFTAPKKYWDLYDREKLPLATFRDASKNGPAIAYHTAGEIRNYSDMPDEVDSSTKVGYLIPVDTQKELIHGYYAAVTYADALIGQLMETIRSLELDDNTIVVIAGDHGWHLGDHNLWCKHSNFEQATRSPLIISAPNMTGVKSDQPCEFVDIFPTLCDLTQLEVPAQLEGASLVPMMQNSEIAVKAYAMSQYPRGDDVMGYSLRTDRYRYTVWMDGWFVAQHAPV